MSDGIHAIRTIAAPGAASEGTSNVMHVLRVSLHDQVAARLRTMLVEGEIGPGAKLNERELCERLQVSPADDAHAYAFYFYTRDGDHIGWHYDTSYYRGRRYTVLLGVIDDSSCRLEYELHTREPGVAAVAGVIQYPPGALLVFDGDKLKHRITPARGVSLTFEYVTDPRMSAWWRLISNFKDAVAYFGLRQVFGRRRAVGRRVER